MAHTDPTGDWEKTIETVSDEVVKAIRELTPKIANRPLGTVKVPKDLLYDEWANRDETYWQSFHEKAMEAPESGGNPIKALLMLAEHDKAMQERSK